MYSEEYLEIDRPKPLSDDRIEQLQLDVLNGKVDKEISDKVYDDFKSLAERWILSTKLNNLSGLDKFSNTDIIIGCTQFIDNIYMQGAVQTIQHDYRYHERLGFSTIVEPENLIPNIPLIIAMPFPHVGAPHPDMNNILNEAVKKNIPVHIDGAWITCCKDIDFNFDHPAIKSVGISLSKGLGLGWNRIGLRWSREKIQDSISIMNDFHMNNRALVIIGLYFLKNLPVDYLWNLYELHYNKVCKDFNLEKTNSIYLAKRNGEPVGISPLIRYLIKNGL